MHVVSHVTTTSDFSCSYGRYSQTMITVHFTFLAWGFLWKIILLGNALATAQEFKGKLMTPGQQRMGLGRYMLQDPNFKKRQLWNAFCMEPQRVPCWIEPQSPTTVINSATPLPRVTFRVWPTGSHRRHDLAIGGILQRSFNLKVCLGARSLERMN